MQGSDEPKREGWRQTPADEPPSFGPMSESHWSRTRKDANREAIEHMRERSRKAGVAEGGGRRNTYCLECDGVVPFTAEGVKAERCPHCGAKLERVQAMFNWVEIDEVPRGDLAALARVALAGLAGLAVIGLVAWWLLR